MNIRLTPEQENWVRKHFETEGLSIEDAVRQIVYDRMAQSNFENDDMEWALPLVQAGLDDIANGAVRSLADVRESIGILIQK